MNTTGPRSGAATTTTTGMNVQRITARLRITARRTDTRRTATISRLFPIPTLSQQLPVQPRRSIIAPAYAALREQKPLKTEMLLATAGAVGRATGTVRTPASVKIVTMERQKNCSGGTATCQERATCSACGNAYGALGEHTLIEHVHKEPTCTELGNQQYWECSTCHALFSDAEGSATTTMEDITIAQTGHDWDKPVWDWSDDGKTASAIFTCQNDSAHTQSLKADITSEVKKIRHLHRSRNESLHSKGDIQ